MSEENVYKKAGEILAEVRKARGVSLDEVAEVTKIRKVFLEAIEEGNYAELPELVYSCGFVRSYAKLFGLDYASLSEQFKAESASGIAVSPIKTVMEPEDEAESSLPDKKTVAGVLFLIILVYAGWTLYGVAREKMLEPATVSQSYSDKDKTGNIGAAAKANVVSDERQNSDEKQEVKADKTDVEDTPVLNLSASVSGADANDETEEVEQTISDKPMEQKGPQISIKEEAFFDEAENTPVAEELAVKTEAAGPAAYGKQEGSRVTLEAEKEVWVQIENGKNKVLLTRILAKGDKYFVPADDNTLRLRAGSSDALAVYVDGKRVAPLSARPGILRNVKIDAESLLAREI